jgi:lipoate-protein ligase A
MKRGHFLNTGEHSAAYNMACDELLLEKVKNNHDLVFFKVYGWAPPAFSLGYSQRINRELDVEKCRQAGYDIVRRPTGGRLVLHQRELAYTFVVYQKDFTERQNLSQ